MTEYTYDDFTLTDFDKITGITDYTFGSPTIGEFDLIGAIHLYEDLPDLTDIIPTLAQTSTLEKLWLTTRSVTRVAVGHAGIFLDAIGAPTQHTIKPYKLEGVTVDQNEDPIAGATVYLLRGDFRGYSLVQMTTSDGSGNYLFYVDDPDDEYVVISWKWDAGLGEYIRGVTDRDLTAVAV